jgi:hypothetical protein
MPGELWVCTILEVTCRYRDQGFHLGDDEFILMYRKEVEKCRQIQC